MIHNGQTPEEYIYHYIRGKVMSHDIFPGNKINEAQLADETGISRTPIRAALKHLAYEGLVDAYPNRGCYVASPTLKEMQDVYRCRQVLEAEATRTACLHITDQQVEELRALLDRQVIAHRERNLQMFLEVNSEFHTLISKISQNPFYLKYIQELNLRCDVYLLFYDKFQITPVEKSFALKEHTAIVEALQNRDADACYRLAAEHNQSTLDQLNNDKI